MHTTHTYFCKACLTLLSLLYGLLFPVNSLSGAFSQVSDCSFTARFLMTKVYSTDSPLNIGIVFSHQQCFDEHQYS